MAKEELDEGFLEGIEESALMCKDFLLSDINIEKNIIVRAHNFEDKIMSIDNLFARLLFSEADEYTKLHGFLDSLLSGFLRIQKLLEKEIKHEFHFVREEKGLVAKLKADLQHKNWRAAFKVSKEVSEKEVKELRVDIGFLKKIIKEFRIILDLIEKEEHVVIEEEQIVALKHKGKSVEELNHLVHYVHALYQFVRFYKNVFEQMVKKEELLLLEAQKKNSMLRRGRNG